MTWIAPVDSTDARERRELEAEQAADERAADVRHTQLCRDGWLGEDSAGHPIACLRCRPWLAETRCTTCGQSSTTCRTQRAARHGPCCDHCDHHTAKTTRGLPE